MREFTLGPPRESLSVPGGCQLVGKIRGTDVPDFWVIQACT